MKRTTLTLSLWATLVATANAQTPETTAKLTLDIPLLDVPANLQHNALGIKQFNPSMQQSLNWTKSFYSLKQYGVKRLFFKPTKKHSVAGKVWRTAAVTAIDYGLETQLFYIPLSTAWSHEEWHRSVMNQANIKSFNEINTLPFGASTIPVNRITDEDLARFKATNNPAFVRMGAAGIESQLEYVKAMQKENFFNQSNLISQASYWFNLDNVRKYVESTSDETGDITTKIMEQKEGTNIPKRDFTGLDMTAWIYDLGRPTEAYTARGLHPSGVGIRRYRLTTDLNADELSYLKQMGKLQLLNYVSPHLFFINSIRISDNLRVNAGLFHQLTSFGYDAGANLFAVHRGRKIFASLHNYRNFKHSFYGIEAQLLQMPLQLGTQTYHVSPTVHVWTQPKNQDFHTSKAQLGGRLAIEVAKSTGIWRPYLALSGKSAGWVAGDVFLNSNFSGRFGIKAVFGEKEK